MRERDRKKLWGRAGGRCSVCREDVSDTGEEAHIVARRADGPRGDSTFPVGQLDGYENRILLCPTCHTMVDGKPGEWTVERLKQMKAENEGHAAQHGERLHELGGTIKVRATGGRDVAGVRICEPTRIKPGTRVEVDATGTKRVTGVEIGGAPGE